MKDPLADACLDCPSGFYCVNDKSQDPEACPQGFYCPVRTGFNWQPCPKGTYGNKLGLANITSEYVRIEKILVVGFLERTSYNGLYREALK